MNTWDDTPEKDYEMGLKLTHKGRTVFAGVATFLFSGLLAGGYYLGTTEGDLPVPTLPAGYNCSILADCDSTWVQVPQELGDSLAEGDDVGGDRPWESCFTQASTNLLACPWGVTLLN